MSEFNSFIPRTEDRYVLNINGDVIDCNLGVVVSKVVGDTKVVELDWYDGYRTYDVGLITIVTSLGINIPSSRWNDIVIHYRDDDKTNTVSSNIYYKFPEPIEAPDYPGYYYIPFTTKYAIDRAGNVISTGTGKLKKWFVTKPGKNGIRGGYHITQASDDRDERTNISRHRSLALTFIPYEGDPARLEVNHLDGIGGSDHIGNLEWTDSLGNMTHAHDTGLIRKSYRKILLKSSRTGETMSFDSIAACARHLKISVNSLYSRINRNSGRFYRDGTAVKYDDGSPWLDGEVRERTLRTETVFRDIFTGVVVLARSQRQAAELAGVSDKAVWWHVHTNSCKPLGRYIFRRYDESGNDWPTFDEKQLDEFRDALLVHSPADQ